MQFNDVWLVLSQLTAHSPAGWLLEFWFRWLVVLAVGYTILLLFVIIIRNLTASLSVVGHQMINTATWVITLSLLLVLPSLLVRLLPGFALRLAGIDPGLVSLQQLSYTNLNYLLSVFQHLSIQGGIGLLFIVLVSLHAPTRQILVTGRTQHTQLEAPIPAGPPAPPAVLPQVQLLDELTPLPIETNPVIPVPAPTIPVREPSPVMPATMTMNADEITLIPAPPLPLSAWLQSISYKGGNNKIFELTVTETEIGRQGGHIILDADFSVSSNHAAIHYSDGTFYLSDRSRYQSTWVNEVQVEQDGRAPLHDGDTVRFGESKFSFFTLPWPEITFISGPLQGQSFNRAAPILIGRGNHNHIILPDTDQLPETIARIELDHQQKTYLLKPEDDTVANSIHLATNTGSEGDNATNEPPWSLPTGSGVNIGQHLFIINFAGD
jgi:pSer/pThr/pTyr-binding forkhead associated (FHA) protein